MNLRHRFPISLIALAAEAVTDRALGREQSASIPALRRHAHPFTVGVVDVANLNASGRSHGAQTIVGANDGRQRFDVVMFMEVDFVTRTGKGARVVEGFDVNCSPSYSFTPHTI